MTAVQLGNGKEIERSRKQTDPGGAADGRQQEKVGSDAGMQEKIEKTQQERSAKHELSARWIGESGNELGVEHTIEECRDSEKEAYERARSADIEQRPMGADRRADEDEGTESANQRGEGNKKWIAGTNVMIAAGEEMAEFMRKKNAQQGKGERQAGDERCGMFVKEGEGAEQFVEGDGLIVSVGDRELRAGYQAGAESKKEQDAGNEERFRRRPAGNGRVLPLAERSGAPIHVERNGGRRIFWEWSGHEIFARKRKCAVLSRVS